MPETYTEFNHIIDTKQRDLITFIKKPEERPGLVTPGEYAPGVLQTPITKNRSRLIALSETLETEVRGYLGKQGYIYKSELRLAISQTSSPKTIEFRNLWSHAPYNYQEKGWIYTALLATGIPYRIAETGQELFWFEQDKPLTLPQLHAVDYFINNFSLIPKPLRISFSRKETVTRGGLLKSLTDLSGSRLIDSTDNLSPAV